MLPRLGEWKEEMRDLLRFLLFSASMQSLISLRPLLSATRRWRFSGVRAFHAESSWSSLPDIVTLQPPMASSEELSNPMFLPTSPSLAELVHLPELRNRVAESVSRASVIQALSYEPLLAGKDAILGAETGSGKTLAYFLPLVDRYLSQIVERRAARERLVQQAERQRDKAEAEGQGDSLTWERAALESDVIDSQPSFGIILAPSATLCDQILQMVGPFVTSLKEAGLPISMTRWTDSLLDKKKEELAIIVCSPKTLSDQFKGLEDDRLRQLAFLVLDEADMLLDGSYLRDVEKILERLKLVRRAMVQEGLLRAHERTVQYVLSAATIPTMGTKSIDRYAKKAFPHVSILCSESSLTPVPYN